VARGVAAAVEGGGLRRDADPDALPQPGRPDILQGRCRRLCSGFFLRVWGLPCGWLWVWVRFDIVGEGLRLGFVVDSGSSLSLANRICRPPHLPAPTPLLLSPPLSETGGYLGVRYCRRSRRQGTPQLQGPAGTLVSRRMRHIGAVSSPCVAADQCTPVERTVAVDGCLFDCCCNRLRLPCMQLVETSVTSQPSLLPNQPTNRSPLTQTYPPTRELLYLGALFFQGGAGGGITGFVNNMRQWLWIPVSQVGFGWG